MFIPVYTWLTKHCRGQIINHEQYNTMEFWEDTIEMLPTQFMSWYLNIFIPNEVLK